jgi:capsular polysaccharide biosynthesis protein
LLSPVSDSGSRNELSGLTGQLESIASLAGIAKEGDDNKQEAIATLKSRAFTLQFIKDENLLPTLFPDDWDSRGGNWDTKPGKTPPTSWDAYELFDEEVRQVTESRKTGLVTVAVEWQDPDLAALWANLLVSRINTHMRRRVIEEAEKSVEYLNKELNKTSIVEIQKAIYALIEEQVRRIMMANVREEYSFKVIDPAVAPDVDEYRKPKRGMIIGLSLVGGLTAGMVLALIRQRNSILRKQKAFYDS